MTTLAILGGGFGLYGYLPAALALPATTVVLPRRYQETLARRPELAPCIPRVFWAADDAAALAVATRLVIARRPADQHHLIATLDRYPAIQSVVLEKPLAPTPTEAAWVVDRLEAAGRPFRVGFTLADLPWATAVRAALVNTDDSAPIHVRWHFTAHHVQHQRPVWKRWHAEGGGPLRFYGIQLLAALTRDDTPFDVETTAMTGAGSTGAGSTGAGSTGAMTDDPTRWAATLRTFNGRRVHVDVESAAPAPLFTVHVGGQPVCTQQDPFALPVTADSQDGRVTLLANILSRPVTGSDARWTRRTQALWAAVESALDPTAR